MAAILTTTIEPVGFRMRQGRERPFWEPTPESKLLAMMRQQFGLTSFAAAQVLGIEVWELNELEAGGRTCDWEEAYARLAEAGEVPT
jgi:hypothetical protein